MDVKPVGGAGGEPEWLMVHNAAVDARNWTPAGLCGLLERTAASRRLLARDGGLPVGAALAVTPRPPAAPVVAAWVSVPPTHRGRGVGSRLWEDIRAWAGGVVIETRVEAADEASVAFALARGLTVVREEKRLVHELRTPAPSPGGDSPLVVPLSDHPGLAGALYDVFRHHGSLPGSVNPDEWCARLVADEAAGAQRVTVALQHGRVTGYAVLALLESRPGVASHNGTFVCPDSARRGVATALKAEQVSWARAAGLTRLEASADPDNVAKTRLYLGLGYSLVPGWYVLWTSGGSARS